MAVGLQVWDAGGNVIIDMTRYIPRVVDIRDLIVRRANTWVDVVGLPLSGFKDYAVISLMTLVNGYPITESYMVSKKIPNGYSITSFRGNNITFRVAVIGF